MTAAKRKPVAKRKPAARRKKPAAKTLAKPQAFDRLLATLKPYENNPRSNESAISDVKESLKRYGPTQAIVVDQDDVIIIGHTRFQAALSLGWTKFPVLKLTHLSDAEVKGLRIADNKTGESATWNPELLKVEFTALKKFTAKAPVFTGFSVPEVDKLFKPETPAKAADEYGGATAIVRGSAPRKFWEKNKLIEGTVLDLGGGLDEHEYPMYDMKTQPDPSVLLERYDTVMANYLLNVQPSDHLIDMLLALCYQLTVDDGKVLLACLDSPNMDYKPQCGNRKHKTAGEWLKLIERFFTAERVDANFCGFVCTRGPS